MPHCSATGRLPRGSWRSPEARLDGYDVWQNLRRHAQALRGAYRKASAEHRWDTAWLAPALQHLFALEAGFLPGPSAREG
ncbi:hypothetical protein AB0L50_20540 [Streptomyces flaveolus]|uniref:hypothetical protein n=1 Tax=Streptomyces flaveolus TaxID=67297 RepID=UPI00343DA28F